MTKTDREHIKKKAIKDFKRGDRIADIARRYAKNEKAGRPTWPTIATVSTWAKKAGLKRRRQGCRIKELPNAIDLEIVRQVKSRHNGKPSFSTIGAPFALKRQSVHRLYHRWKDWTPNGLRPPFQPGDLIRFNDTDYTVISAEPLKGVVQDKDGHVIHNFFWSHDGLHAVKL